MLVFELIKNKLTNISKMIKPACAGKTPSIYCIQNFNIPYKMYLVILVPLRVYTCYVFH